jgi:hypothetical protein
MEFFRNIALFSEGSPSILGFFEFMGDFMPSLKVISYLRLSSFFSGISQGFSISSILGLFSSCF